MAGADETLEDVRVLAIEATPAVEHSVTAVFCGQYGYIVERTWRVSVISSRSL